MPMFLMLHADHLQSLLKIINNFLINRLKLKYFECTLIKIFKSLYSNPQTRDNIIHNIYLKDVHHFFNNRLRRLWFSSFLYSFSNGLFDLIIFNLFFKRVCGLSFRKIQKITKRLFNSKYFLRQFYIFLSLSHIDIMKFKIFITIILSLKYQLLRNNWIIRLL
jgi:hypothetical protein